jgi:phosphoribosylaminoimidazolecarboxamide formyltransferase/IMP cyclohydrolase
MVEDCEIILKGELTVRIRRALISVSDKQGIVEFARGLTDLGVEILSTGGTYAALNEAKVPVTAVQDITDFPECLGGRVKTLHPAVHAGILARRDVPTHLKELDSLGIRPIDLVVVNLYPFAATVAKPGVTIAEALENIDIGGPTMIRAAAKNFPGVAVVVNPERYPQVLKLLQDGGGALPENVRQELALEAFGHTAQYDAVIYGYLAQVTGQANRPLGTDMPSETSFPEEGFIPMLLQQPLRYGENPHQQAAFYRDIYPPADSLCQAEQLHGKELSFNNINDGAAAVEMAKVFLEPAVVAIKHANPCGWAVADDLAEAFRKAYEGDPVSIFGGIIACNRPVDGPTAEQMAEIFLEVIIAPDFTDEALDILQKKKNLRLLRLPALANPSTGGWWDWKRVKGGWLVQEADTAADAKDEWQVVTSTALDEGDWADLEFGWKTVKYVKSNAIVVAKDGMTLGVGAGQMNRVEAAAIALKQAKEKAQGAILASDAFFPFDDVVKLAAQYGIRAIIQPGGSIRDKDSITAANEAGIAMIFTGRRHFRH